MNYELTPEEREIEEQADQFVSVTGKERKEVEWIETKYARSSPRFALRRRCNRSTITKPAGVSQTRFLMVSTQKLYPAR